MRVTFIVVASTCTSFTEKFFGDSIRRKSVGDGFATRRVVADQICELFLCEILTEPEGFLCHRICRESVSCDSSNTKEIPTMVALNVANDCFGVRDFLFDETPFGNEFVGMKVTLGQCPLRFDDVEDGLELRSPVGMPFQFDCSTTLAFECGHIVRMRNAL